MKSNHTNTALIVLALLIVGLSCKSYTEGKPAAENAVAIFHNMLAEERYKEIYQGSDKMMKDAASEEDLVKLLVAVNTKLGAVRSSATQSWKVGNYNLVSTVTLVQGTEFENGKGSETFVFVIEGQEAKLAGYHISSLDLLSE